MDNNWKRALSGFWLPVMGGAAYALATRLSLYFFDQLYFPANPSSQIPWYFIRTDLVNGLTMGCIGSVCILIGLLNIKRYPVYGSMLIWQTLIWFGGSAWKAMVILMRTDHPMNPFTAKTVWPDFTSYANDPIFGYGEVVSLLGALIFIIVPYKILKRRAAERI